MARKDWAYVNFPIEQAEVLDYIISKEGRKYGFNDRNDLVRALISDFIGKYEQYKNIIIARKAVRGVNDHDFMQPY